MKPARWAFLILMVPLLASCDWQVPITIYTSTLAPTLNPINLAGPDMQVGSIYSYANDTLLVAVPAGEFSIGHGGSDDPIHRIWLDDFWIFRTKVTNAQYARCVNTSRCSPPDSHDNLMYQDALHASDPVVGVNYAQAVAYCAFMQAHLPSEAEWEKAARGPHANLYPWGNGAPNCDLLNFNNCVGTTTNVTSYPQGKSYYSALDMEGNTFEWVADWYEPLYYRDAPVANPTGPDSGQQRSVRSSSYRSDLNQVTAAARFFDLPENHRADLGFRCVVNPSALAAQSFSTYTPTSLPTSSLVASSPTLIPSSPPTDSIFTLVPTLISLPTLPPPTLPNILPTLAPLPTLAAAPTVAIPKPTLAPAPLPVPTDVGVCQPKVCTLPAIWDALKCKCVTP